MKTNHNVTVDVEYGKNGQPVFAYFMTAGKCYSPIGAAVQEWDENTGKLIRYSYHNSEGFSHRDGGLPAYALINPDNDIVYKEVYYENGQEHRENDLPACIVRDEITGKTIVEEYKLNGNHHRDGDKPAIRMVDNDSDVVIFEGYATHGTYHKVIERDPETGEIVYSGLPKRKHVEGILGDFYDECVAENQQFSL